MEVSNAPFGEDRIREVQQRIAKSFSIGIDDAKWFLAVNKIEKDMYDPADDNITIIYKDNTTKDISEASELLGMELLSKKIRKYYLCYQRV